MDATAKLAKEQPKMKVKVLVKATVAFLAVFLTVLASEPSDGSNNFPFVNKFGKTGTLFWFDPELQQFEELDQLVADEAAVVSSFPQDKFAFQIDGKEVFIYTVTGNEDIKSGILLQAKTSKTKTSETVPPNKKPQPKKHCKPQKIPKRGPKTKVKESEPKKSSSRRRKTPRRGPKTKAKSANPDKPPKKSSSNRKKECKPQKIPRRGPKTQAKVVIAPREPTEPTRSTAHSTSSSTTASTNSNSSTARAQAARDKKAVLFQEAEVAANQREIWRYGCMFYVWICMSACLLHVCMHACMHACMLCMM